MNPSAEKICLPTFNSEELMKLIDKFLLIEKFFGPSGDGYSLYLRPILIGTSAFLGVWGTDRALLCVIASPVGPYHEGGFKPVSLEAIDYAVKAYPSGVGNKKLGANYAPYIKPQLETATRSYNQNLWLFDEEGYITEVGTMNTFFVFKDASGKKELATVPLDGTILECITRDSILELYRERLPVEEWTISKRKFTISEVKEKVAKNELVEAFGTGTAAIVSPIKNIGCRSEDIKVPIVTGNTGELTKTVADWINKIQYGIESYKNWSKIAN